MRLDFVLRSALSGLKSNLTMTIALVITTAVSVGLLVSGILVSQMTADTKAIYLERVEVMIQLDERTSASDSTCAAGACAAIKKTLEEDPRVETVTYRNREESYARFVELFEDTDPLLVQETSPEALPAALHVRLVDPTDTAAIDAVAQMPAVDTIVDQVEEVRGATDNLDTIRNITFVLAAIQALAALFLIGNMVHIAAFNRQVEMSIMRMVGATRWFSQGPFILEAVIATAVGVILAAIGVVSAKLLIVDRALESLYRAQLLAPIDSVYLWVAIPVVGLLSMVCAAAAATVALRTYIKQ